METKPKVALLGLGTMGHGMAVNLLKAGFPLTVYNRTRAKAEALATMGATVAETESEIREAIAFHLEGLREDGLAIPDAQSRVDYVEVVE